MPYLMAYRRHQRLLAGRGQAGVDLLDRRAARACPRVFAVAAETEAAHFQPAHAFWNDSLNVRPMAIVSPTLFICVVRRGSASGNFSKANRGILVTT